MLWSSWLIVVVALGCGGGEEEVVEQPVVEQDTGAERPPERNDGVQIEGLMGTITQDQVQRGIEPRMGRFESCFMNRMGELRLLRGRIELAFRVHTDGSVRWVYPRASTVGDRDTERCVIEVASTIRFLRPRGGEAEFAYPLEWPGDEDRRPPVTMDVTRIEPLLEANSAELVSQCGRASYAVTAYIGRGGQLLAVGASTAEQTAAANLDCVVEGVRAWEMPDPGSYPAKISFELQ
jgi:hypothetical protein